MCVDCGGVCFGIRCAKCHHPHKVLQALRMNALSREPKILSKCAKNTLKHLKKGINDKVVRD